MLYLEISRYVRPLEEIDTRLAPHREWLRHNIALGHILIAGRRMPRVGGVIIFRAQTEAEARLIAESDPFVIAGVAEFNLVAWEPTMRSAEAPESWGFEALVIASASS